MNNCTIIRFYRSNKINFWLIARTKNNNNLDSSIQIYHLLKYSFIIIFKYLLVLFAFAVQLSLHFKSLEVYWFFFQVLKVLLIVEFFSLIFLIKLHRVLVLLLAIEHPKQFSLSFLLFFFTPIVLRIYHFLPDFFKVLLLVFRSDCFMDLLILVFGGTTVHLNNIFRYE